MKTIYSKITKVMSQVNRVPKNGYNSFHKYHYATESDLTESIRPILFEAGLAFFTNVLQQERDGEFTKVQMEFILADIESGEILKSTYWGEGQDKGDKGLYKAYTGATKYFLMKTFLIPTGDDPEQDISVDERNSKSSGNKSSNKNSKNNGYGNNLEEALRDTARKHGIDNYELKKLSPAQVNRLFSIAKSKGVDAAAVKAVLMKDYKKTQAEDLTKQEYDEMIKRIEQK